MIGPNLSYDHARRAQAQRDLVFVRMEFGPLARLDGQVLESANSSPWRRGIHLPFLLQRTRRQCKATKTDADEGSPAPVGVVNLNLGYLAMLAFA